MAETRQKPKTEDTEAPVKSYWYPDKTPDMNEVNIGYTIWRHSVVLVPLISIPVVLAVFWMAVSTHDQELYKLYHVYQQQRESKEFWQTVTMIGGAFAAMCVALTVYLLKKRRPVYMIDFALFQPREINKVTHDHFMSHTEGCGFFDQESIEFQRKLLYRTGLGNDTYLPSGILSNPPEPNMQHAREEALEVMSGCIDELFKKTGITPNEIDILVVNCSLFNPTPSLTAMVINKYKMRSDIKNYNLAGMGCSASVISVDLVKDLLQVHKNQTALIVSTENITQNWYPGKVKSMLISNTLFRMGGAAILMSNKWKDGFRAKYKLNCTVRVHKGANDMAYNCVYQSEDPEGKRGVSISKDLLTVAGDALKSNLTILGPLVLPWSEQIKFFLNLCLRKVEGLYIKDKSKRTPAYIPDFKKAFTHFCIHAGGRAIIDGLEQNLKLEPHHVEPSRATLYRYGNTSSSSIWYELQFIERSGRMKKGDTVWQIALGSGFKCNSAVWQRIKY
jgi:3-ketoacyl-CoA synthase